MATAADIFAQAWQLHQAGRYAQAEDLYRQALQVDARHTDAWCFLGAACQAQGKLAEAEHHFRQAFQLLPSHPSAGNFLAIALAQQGKLDEAATCFQQLLRADPGNADIYNNLGLVYIHQGRWDQALVQFRQAVAVRPAHAESHGNLGLALHRLGRLEDAIASYQQALYLKGDLTTVREQLNQALQARAAAAPGSGAGRWPAGQAAGLPHDTQAQQIQSLYRSALTQAEQGRLLEAQAGFQQILQVQPDHVDALNNLGNVLLMQGQADAAIPYYERALRVRPNFASVYYNRGVALQRLGRDEEAMSSYQQALAIDPAALDARNNLGNILRNKGRMDEAIECYRQVLRFKPDFAEVRANLGIALGEQRKWDEAIPCYQEALRLKPNYVEAHNGWAVALTGQGRLDEAVARFHHALQIRPDFAEAHNSLGITLLQQYKFDEAIRSFQRALQLKPDIAEAHNNLGNGLRRVGKFEEAVGCYHEALRLKPTYTEAFTNLGNVSIQLGKFSEAMAYYDEALRREPKHIDTHFNRSLLWLLLGDWEKGWREYEWRWQTTAFPRNTFLQPRWDGSPLKGRTILVQCEQGLGDTLQFIRFVPLVRARGGKVIVQCQPPLTRLLAGVEGIDQVIPQGSPLPPFDAFVPLLSLPHLLHTTVDNVPANVPYLRPDAALVSRWRTELASRRDHTLRIGLAWQGNPAYHADRQRSIPLAEFASLANMESVELFSLQVGKGAEQIAPFNARFGSSPGVTDLGSRFDPKSFADAAAAIQNLDLVITVDTAAAHLAGALGVQVWVLLPLVSEWRWLLKREDCPWYPTARLFRQRQQDNWAEVMQRVAAELKAHLKRR